MFENIFTLRMGRMISSSKTAPKGHICVFNGNLCTKTKGKFWFGDIDLTDDIEQIKAAAKDHGENVYVLREMDARFKNDPVLENAVAVVTPSGEIIISQGSQVR